MDRRFLAASTLALFLSFDPRPALAQTVHLWGQGPLLTVEHAELVLSADPSGPMDLYLVVWNGTAKSATVSEVTSPAMAGIAIASGPHSRDVPRPGSRGGLTVPARSELLMRERGLHLLAAPLDEALSPGAVVPITVGFLDGSTRTVMADIRAAGTPPKDHHHGS